MAADAHIFGVRHHGPGSARRLIEALGDLQPAVVLIEGPADLSHLLPMLAEPTMVPPVALLAYPAADPAQAVFWPFAVFSPEYQAARWAATHGAEARFIDLPTVWRLRRAEAPDAPDGDEAAAGDPAETGRQAQGPERPSEDRRIERDPIGALAAAAGYEDGESWWRDVIEENPSPGPVFAAVADAMSALRDHAPEISAFEAAREAHMRLEIAKARKASAGPVAVVCGAWHAPALREKRTAKEDRALLKGGPDGDAAGNKSAATKTAATKIAATKIAATWAPWTAPRLAFASGYGAGVDAPGWCLHLWDAAGPLLATRWIARVAAALREDGHVVSTASLIETERLAKSLAALRGRPQAGFEELREAAVACLCFGSELVWRTIATPLLLGAEVGAIPDDAPMAPLLEDLQRQQRAARLKPEALSRELSLDLRSESGLFRSTLLHRLSALGVPWGQLADAGRSRGTFRERWTLRWEPEFAVELVENLVHGPTIERAANGRVTAQLYAAQDLGRLAELVFAAMTAQLGAAAEKGVALIGDRAAQTSDCSEMLGALPPLADLLRYGAARATDAGQLSALFTRIAVQGALALPYAVRSLDADAAEAMRQKIKAADAAIRLVEAESGALRAWTQALARAVDDPSSTRLVAGAAARLLYEADHMAPEAAVALLGRMLSPGTAVADAAAFFAGFFEGGGQRLIYDQELRDAVDAWLCGLEDDAFTEHLPLFRRVFAGLDKMERRRLLEAAIGPGGAVATGLAPAPDAEARWAAQFARLTEILALNEAGDDR